MNEGGRAFLAARDFLIAHRDDHAAACAGFRWPELDRFNWALDFFDEQARGNHRPALRIVDDEGGETRISFAGMAERSNRVANHLRALGVRRGDRVLVMLPNVAPLWEIMLAAIKLGAVFSPASTLLSAADLQDRVERGEMRHVIADPPSAEKLAAVPGDYTRLLVGGEMEGWRSYAEAYESITRFPAGRRDPRRRPLPPLLHLGDHRQAEDGAAHPPELSGGAPLDDVLDRPARGGHAPQHQLARLGQARLELLLRAVERGRHRLHPPAPALRRPEDPGGAGPPRRHHPLRAAHRLADADPGGPQILPGAAPRAGERGRAAQPRGDHPGARGLGPDRPRRLRPDRDHLPDRQSAGGGGEGGGHGQAAARLPYRPPRRGRQPRRRGGDRPPARPPSAAADGGLSGQPRGQRPSPLRRPLPHLGRGHARRRRHLLVRGPGRRRLQELPTTGSAPSSWRAR